MAKKFADSIFSMSASRGRKNSESWPPTGKCLILTNPVSEKRLVSSGMGGVEEVNHCRYSAAAAVIVVGVVIRRKTERILIKSHFLNVSNKESHLFDATVAAATVNATAVAVTVNATAAAVTVNATTAAAVTANAVTLVTVFAVNIFIGVAVAILVIVDVMLNEENRL